jgi:Ca2+-binding EF-hand superfamily protein
MKIRATRPVLFTLAAVLAVSGAAWAHGHPAHRFFAEADENKDEKITQAEAQKFGEAHFQEADENKDGFITTDEMRGAFGRHGKFREHAEEKFAEKDTNKDGKLSKDEVPKMPEEWFKKIDKNQDGGLTREEFEASWKERHAAHEARG